VKETTWRGWIFLGVHVMFKVALIGQIKLPFCRSATALFCDLSMKATAWLHENQNVMEQQS
jgi:hypothetical protein